MGISMIKEGSVITLGNNHKYNVIFSTVLNNDNYIFVSNIDNLIDSCFYKANNEKRLELVKDSKIIDALLRQYKDRMDA